MSLLAPLPLRIEMELRSLLLPGETVSVKLKGMYKEALIVSGRRVIVLKTGFMTDHNLGVSLFQAIFADVSGVHVSSGAGRGYFEVNSAGMPSTPKAFGSLKRSSSPTVAPNCVSFVSYGDRAKFTAAANLITQIRSDQQSAAAPPAVTAEVRNDPFEDLRKLGELRDAGVITTQDFEAKKVELLGRL